MNRLIAIAAAVLFLVGGPPGMAQAQTAEAVVDTSLVREMTLGDENAPVTVIEYASFTCPHCANFHAEVLDDLKANYIDTGKVRFVYREVYFDRFGLWAGMVARCGGGEKYFGIADLIYERQSEWTAGETPGEVAGNLAAIGRTAGLSEAEVGACLQDVNMAQALIAVFEETTQADDINSTPSFVIDGTKYSNMSYDAFAAILDEKLGG